jgi:cobalt/nickel transport protein
MKTYKKYIIFLGILVVLSPLGLILPDYFKAGDAWGEWSVESVKQQTGQEPEGMKRTSEVYSAPIPDYNMGKEDDPLSKISASYIISGLIGTGIILLITFGTSKLVSRKATE